MNLRGLSKTLQNLLPEEAPIKLNTSAMPESAKKMWATRPVTGALERRANIPLKAQEENVVIEDFILSNIATKDEGFTLEALSYLKCLLE